MVRIPDDSPYLGLCNEPVTPAGAAFLARITAQVQQAIASMDRFSEAMLRYARAREKARLVREAAQMVRTEKLQAQQARRRRNRKVKK